jgi:hypothetical protein
MYEQIVMQTRRLLKDNIPHILQISSISGQYPCSPSLRSRVQISLLKYYAFPQCLYKHVCAECQENTTHIYLFHHHQHHHHHHHHWQNSPFWEIAFLRRFCPACLLNYTFRFSLLWISQQYFFYRARLSTWVQLPTWLTTSLYSYPPVTGWPSYTPRHRVPFSLPSTTHRAKTN